LHCCESRALHRLPPINPASSIAFARNFVRNARRIGGNRECVRAFALTLRNRERYKDFYGASLEAHAISATSARQKGTFS